MDSSKHLHPLTSHHNRSLSNVSATSDACTFHSAHDHPQSSHMEMRPLSSLSQQPPTPLLPSSPTTTKPLSPKLDSIKMSRQDSGYQESSPRTSTSSHHSSQTPSSTRPKRRSTDPSSKSSVRPSTKRATKSSSTAQVLRTSTSGSRPSLSTRHTSPFPRTDIQNIQQPYKFFQFPAPIISSLPPTLPSETEPEVEPEARPVIPATTQYWTSDQTRRLEYAAIDAAGKGVRGFFIRLVPDCILPPGSRRTRFCGDGEEGREG
ncbi:hypothetical protein L207DRAFT_303 [Hyaloscypha variabilis F]|uniref:Uncharacterized protein n=1 Tax=Hyaloscypha variabilis (strain UAMH 11265 / GT02V1 / F) TaxID=1149755 RepID=A0A2J6SB80_HYAVF|nr:hypothetical protein L207DRAFT_303 [Hyaloscypha variabilis F]